MNCGNSDAYLANGNHVNVYQYIHVSVNICIGKLIINTITTECFGVNHNRYR